MDRPTPIAIRIGINTDISTRARQESLGPLPHGMANGFEALANVET
jgi:hypothetical protein